MLFIALIKNVYSILYSISYAYCINMLVPHNVVQTKIYTLHYLYYNIYHLSIAKFKY